MSAPGLHSQPSVVAPPLQTKKDRWCLQATQVELDQALQIFLAERTRLLRVAYRVVGDVGTAEDVVQDTWLRWQRMDRREVKNPAAFLTTATTHLAINLIQSARCRHETPTDTPRAAVVALSEQPTGHAERALAVERMLGFLMTKLTSTELAAYLLRKSFDYPYQAIGEVLETTAPNARQLVRRSQISIASSRVRSVDAAALRRLVAAFRAATGEGDLERLERLLAEGVHQCPASVAGGRHPGRPRRTRPVRTTRSTPSPQAA